MTGVYFKGMRTILTISSILLAISAVHGYQYFQTLIPNGEVVPHPCKPNYLWKGVGHKNAAGGGERNPFGIDFKNAGKSWTTELCQKDSDGDGKTNGEELGDPNCVWSVGNAPENTVGLSHPGVCEPYDSALCREKNTWVDCSSQEFECEALGRERPEDLLNITLRYPETVVPPTETNYYCMTFDLNLNDDYHMIATQPIIDNANVMHHIILYGCSDETAATTSAAPCGMGMQGCFNMIGLWTVGTFGECFHQDIGFPMGTKGYKKVALQFHWNNPLFRSDYTDSSGMTLHLTKNKRTHNAGVMMVGQNYLELPPGRDRIDVEGRCTPEMTRIRVKGPLQFTRALNHMHYLGRSMKMEHYRNGVKLRDIALDVVYSYDSPVLYDFLNPIEFVAGDEIRTTCTFKTKDRSLTVFQGEGTSDEMCYGFITFHPVENVHSTYCTAWRSLDASLFYYQDEIEGCHWKDFINTTHPDTKQLHTRVFSHCSNLGLCLKECIQVVKEVSRHPCMQGDVNQYLKHAVREDPTRFQQMALFLSSMESCNREIARESCPSPNDVIGGATLWKFSFSLLVASFFLSIFIRL